MARSRAAIRRRERSGVSQPRRSKPRARASQYESLPTAIARARMAGTGLFAPHGRHEQRVGPSGAGPLVGSACLRDGASSLPSRLAACCAGPVSRLLLFVEGGRSEAFLVAFLFQICLYYRTPLQPTRDCLSPRAVRPNGAGLGDVVRPLLLGSYWVPPRASLDLGVVLIAAALVIADGDRLALAFEWWFAGRAARTLLNCRHEPRRRRPRSRTGTSCLADGVDGLFGRSDPARCGHRFSTPAGSETGEDIPLSLRAGA